MLADLLWALYGIGRTYTTVLVLIFAAAMLLAAYGSLRLWWERFLSRPLDLAPLTDGLTEEWWESVPRECQAGFERLAEDIDWVLWSDELRWRETEDTQ